ncbi:hypothetical protein Rsub_08147 [Raphidocelis subcapitata]|uniref:AP2/ERF domain-containing protein n=1 Tax=Raphidocelis subcapitata TaxID=307507 RepID=A0A2V0P4W2_9CHLO|nr:hypothetical protein Rsub_08147 [Raphidocelis subcapitata]|eukprot:GBF94904.1 hypothetical protein Rsub_08147 [Raphidocelis subcapitata]
MDEKDKPGAAEIVRSIARLFGRRAGARNLGALGAAAASVGAPGGSPASGSVIDELPGGAHRAASHGGTASGGAGLSAEVPRGGGGPQGKESQFRGVYWNENSGRWYSRIRHDKKLLYLGCFDDEAEAARAFDAKAVELRGAQTRTNFPIGSDLLPTGHAGHDAELGGAGAVAVAAGGADAPPAGAASGSAAPAGRQLGGGVGGGVRVNLLASFNLSAAASAGTGQTAEGLAAAQQLCRQREGDEPTGGDGDQQH